MAGTAIEKRPFGRCCSPTTSSICGRNERDEISREKYRAREALILPGIASMRMLRRSW
jgi:hypothetical protein